MTPEQITPGLTEHDLIAELEQSEQQREAALARLDALGQSLAKTRAEAIAARQASGIEEEWLEDEEFYEGIDDFNRGESRAWRQKPPGRAERRTDEGTQSTVFPNITGPYVDAAAARIADMLLPTDDRSWALKPTPMPDLVGISNGRFGPQMLREAAALHPAQPESAKKYLATAAQAAAEVLAEAKEKAERAQKRIEDWHVECQWHAQVRLVIEDAARIGCGVLKGPTPVRKVTILWQDGALAKITRIQPSSRRIDPWNFFPDPSCGENIQNGAYTWERDYLTRKQLRELKDQEGYIAEQIERCLEEGPQRATAEYKDTPEPVTDQAAKNRFEIWHFHGTAEKEDLVAAGCDCEGITDPHVPAVVTMVNNRVIKAALNPLDTGEFGYDVMVWRRRSGHWAGKGVARQIRTAQKMVTASTRNLMDNAGIAAAPMIVFKQGAVYAANGREGIAPRKIWYIAEDADEMADARAAIGQVKVDMLVNELIRIIELGLKLAEDVTGLPMLLQGQMGKAPETLGGMQMLHNNASTVLRRLAKLFDDRVTEPHVRRYYHWLLQYGEDAEKGDYCIDARGSSALVERDLENQTISQMGAIVLDPRFGLDPKRWASEFLKSKRLDVKRFEYEDEQWQKIIASMAAKPSDPRLEVAQLKAQSEERLAKFWADYERDVSILKMRFEENERSKDRALKAWLAKLEQQGAQSISLTDLKAKLADTTIKIGAQERISARSDRARQVAKPAVEPVGRARPGQAFQH